MGMVACEVRQAALIFQCSAPFGSGAGVECSGGEGFQPDEADYRGCWGECARGDFGGSCDGACQQVLS